MKEEVILSWMLAKELLPLIDSFPEWDIVVWFKENLRATAHGSGEGLTHAEIDRFRKMNMRWCKLHDSVKLFYQNSYKDKSVRWVLYLVLTGESREIHDGLKGFIHGKYREQNGHSCPADLFPNILV